MNSVCVIVPAFNEEENISPVLNGINAVMRENDFIAECILVDDCSGDLTAEISRRYSLKYLRNGCRRGYGASIKRGVDNTEADLICIIDADNTYFARDIPALCRAMDGHDIVIGARNSLAFPLHQRLAKALVRLCLRVIFGLDVRDINSGLILARKDMVKTFRDFLSDGFSFSAGITLAALLSGSKAAFVPIAYSPRNNKSKVQVLRYIFTFIRSYCRLMRLPRDTR